MVAKSKNRFWQIRAAADNPKVGEVLIYGNIASYKLFDNDVAPKEFKEELDKLGDVDELRVYINSDGGDVFAGQAIYSMLKRHKARIIVYIDGLAASIASVIAMAGDRIIMPANAMMMIHQPWTIAAGNAADFRKLADDLDKVAESIVTVYSDRTGMSREEIISLMDAETWMTAEEAVEMGFADEIEEGKRVAASLRDGQLIINGLRVDLSRYRNPPKFGFLPPSDEDIKKAFDVVEEALDKACGDEEPPQEPQEDDKLALLALELELLTGSSF